MKKALLTTLFALWASAACAQFGGSFGSGAGFSYNPPASGGGGACSQWTTVAARLSGSENTAAFQTFICGLVTDGIYSHMSEIQVLATDSLSDALIDLATTQHTLTAAGTGATFTANAGINPSGTGWYNSTMNFSTDANWAAASGMFAIWINDSIREAGYSMGAAGATFHNYMIPYGNSFTSQCELNGVGGTGTTGATPGLFACDLSSSTTLLDYKNGASAGTITVTAGTVDNDTLQIFNTAGGAGTSPTHNIAFVAAGASLGTTGQANLYSRVHTLLHTINATLFP